MDVLSEENFWFIKTPLIETNVSFTETMHNLKVRCIHFYCKLQKISESSQFAPSDLDGLIEDIKELQEKYKEDSKNVITNCRKLIRRLENTDMVIKSGDNCLKRNGPALPKEKVTRLLNIHLCNFLSFKRCSETCKALERKYIIGDFTESSQIEDYFRIIESSDDNFPKVCRKWVKKHECVIKNSPDYKQLVSLVNMFTVDVDSDSLALETSIKKISKGIDENNGDFKAFRNSLLKLLVFGIGDTKNELREKYQSTEKLMAMRELFKNVFSETFYSLNFPMIEIYLQLGISTLKSRFCKQSPNYVCSCCLTPLKEYVECLPYTKYECSNILCAYSNTEISQEIECYVIMPYYNVYSSKALKFYDKARKVLCIPTRTQHSINSLKRIYF